MSGAEVLGRWDAAFNSAHCARAAELFAVDAEYVDHRPLGWMPLQGREAIRAWYSAVAEAVSPTAASRVVAERPPWIVGEQVFRFTAPGREEDGSGEVTIGVLLRMQDGLIAELDLFDRADQAVAALATRMGAAHEPPRRG